MLLSFLISIQIRGLGTKYQDLVISFRLGEGETPPQFHIISFQARIKKILFKDETGKINNIIGKYIMELLKLKHLECYIATFELNYRNF